MLSDLTNEEIAELRALAKTNDVVGTSFLMRCHWHQSGYQKFARRGLVTWGDPPPGFDKRRFAGVTITLAGRSALDSEGDGR